MRAHRLQFALAIQIQTARRLHKHPSAIKWFVASSNVNQELPRPVMKELSEKLVWVIAKRVKKICLNTSLWSACMQQSLSQNEICDREDNNCDGKVDNGIRCDCKPGEKQKCYNGPTQTINQGVCQYGIQYCESDRKWGRCLKQIKPSPEECDGKDNNCNGKIDEDIICECEKGTVQSCYTGRPEELQAKGICKAGNMLCGPSNQWGRCIGEVKAKQETCNGRDDDCDGKTDELEDIKNTPCINTLKKGPCTKGELKCVDGVIRCYELFNQQSKEVCGNGVDDDCDGIVDNTNQCEGCEPGFTKPCYPPDRGCIKQDSNFLCQGRCKAGVQYCLANRKWGSCVGIVTPSQEICDGRDNDCNGIIDDAIRGLGVSCQTGRKGICSLGKKDCKEGSLRCIEDDKPKQEICDGKDNNCDGNIDENLFRSCYTGTRGTLGVGMCRSGNSQCKQGKWQACQNEIKPDSTDICDSKDNNCDGKVDENCRCKANQKQNCGISIGTCRKGVQTCNNSGRWGPCLGGQKATKEICDGKDNNCDGNIDEKAEVPVGRCQTGKSGICKRGYYSCISGKLICQSIDKAETEKCDGIDNDCNGKIDDNLAIGQACSTGKPGICSSGISQCTNGNQSCKDTQAPQKELCFDGKDNDCNGIVDGCCSLTQTPAKMKLGSLIAYDVSISKDGRRALISRDSSKPELWDLVTKKRISRFYGHKTTVYYVQFAPDNLTFASGSEGGLVIFWDIKTKKPIGKVYAHSDAVYRVKYSKDGKYLITGSKDGTAKLIDVKARRVIRSFSSKPEVYDITFDPANKQILVVGINRKIISWDVATGKQLFVISTPHTDEVSSIDFHPSGLEFATASYDGKVLIWDTKTRKVKQTLQIGSEFEAVRYSPNGGWLAASSYKGTLALWQTGKRYSGYKNISQTNQHLYAVTWSSNSRRLYSVGEEPFLFIQGCP